MCTTTTIFARERVKHVNCFHPLYYIVSADINHLPNTYYLPLSIVNCSACMRCPHGAVSTCHLFCSPSLQHAKHCCCCLRVGLLLRQHPFDCGRCPLCRGAPGDSGCAGGGWGGGGVVQAQEHGDLDRAGVPGLRAGRPPQARTRQCQGLLYHPGQRGTCQDGGPGREAFQVQDPPQQGAQSQG